MDDKPDFEELAKGLEVCATHEKTVVQIMTLAIEYEHRTISAERFADRVLEIIRSGYTKYAKQKQTS